NRSAAVVSRLLQAGANPNDGSESPVMAAARSGSVEVMKLLLSHGGDANAVEAVRGQTALMWAVAERHADVACLLIDYGADLHARTIVVRPSGPRGGGGGGGAGNGANGFTP